MHPDTREVFRYLIDTPKMENKQKGDKISLIIRVYFGQTEIKVDTIFNDTTLKRQSFQYYAKDEAEYKKIEKEHHSQRSPSPPIAFIRRSSTAK